MKGTCGNCGRATWRTEAKLCRDCYNAQLRQRTGPANPEWENFTSTNPQQGRDRATRRKALGLCERCGEAPAIDRHHKDEDQLNNAPENIEGLCRRCHMIIDGRRARLIERITLANQRRGHRH